MEKGLKTLSKGIFTLSIDYEFAWGYADSFLSIADKKRIRQEVKIVERLIALFEKYNIPVTWAVVGHLLEQDCGWKDGVPHPEYSRPVYKDEKKDWFAQHPPRGELQDILWFDSKKIIDKIRNSSVLHEIGSHSYAHIIYGDKDIDHGNVIVDIENARRIHEKNNLPFDSFIFPRNKEGFYHELKSAGIKYFRGTTKRWFHSLPRTLERVGHLLDYFLFYNSVVVPSQHESGLINIPDSLLLLGRNGIRRIIPPTCMKQKIFKGVQKANEEKKIFHLWFHPSNFSYDTDTQFEILEITLRRVVALREKGDIDVLTMNSIGVKVTQS